MEHKGTVYFFHWPVWGGEDDRGQPVLPAAQNTKPNAVYLDGDEIRWPSARMWATLTMTACAGRPDLPVCRLLRPGYRRGVLLHRHV